MEMESIELDLTEVFHLAEVVERLQVDKRKQV